MLTASGDNSPAFSGGMFKLPITEPFYIGLGVSAHNNSTIETAIFSNVMIENLEQKPDSVKKIQSTLETIAIASFDRRVVYHTVSHIEAPNWSPDGSTLIYNSRGLLYKIPVTGGSPELTGTAKPVELLDKSSIPNTQKCALGDGNFDGFQGKVFKCSGCGAHYHENCLAIQLQDGTCKICGKIFLY